MTTEELTKNIETLEDRRTSLMSVPFANRTSAEKTEIMTIDSKIKALKKAMDKAMNQILRSQPGTTEDAALAQAVHLFVNPQLWFRHYIETNNVIIEGGKVSINGRKINHSEFYDYIIVTLMNNKTDLELRGAKLTMPARDLIQSLMHIWWSSEMAAFKRQVLATISHNPNVDDEVLRQWIYLTTGTRDEMYVNVMKHWIQCIKKKMRGDKVDYHLFPVFYGNQGDGKTTAIKRLLDPIKSLLLNLTVTQSLDPTYIGMYEEKAVVFFDEMDGTDKVSINALKRMITLETVDGRPPYGRKVEPVQQNCMFIGASNRMIVEMIKDNEMRRFVQIDSVARENKYMAEMDALNVLAIWQCVDESLDYVYYLESETSIKQHQLGLRTLTPVQHWIQEYGVIKPPLGDPGKWIAFDDIYHQYENWRNNNGYEYSTNHQSFGRQLNFGDNNKMRKEVDGVKATYYKVASTCELRPLNVKNRVGVDVFDIKPNQ